MLDKLYIPVQGPIIAGGCSITQMSVELFVPCPYTMARHRQQGDPRLSQVLDCQWWLGLRPILSAQ